MASWWALWQFEDRNRLTGQHKQCFTGFLITCMTIIAAKTSQMSFMAKSCACHDAGVLAYTLASWQGFRRMALISVTTQEFSMKVLRRGRSQQLLWEMSTIPHFIVNNCIPTVIARNTFIVIARLHRSRGNLMDDIMEIATSLSLLAMTENWPVSFSRNDRSRLRITLQWQKPVRLPKKSIFLKNALREIALWTHPDSDFPIYPFTIFLRG